MIIGLAGLIGSGKDTVAKYLVEHHGFVQYSWASTVKDCLSIIFGWKRSLLEGDTPESRQWRETVDPWWSARLDIPNFTPRWAMTNFATDAMRDHFHSDIWVASMEYRLQTITDNIVISDCRFPNELNSVKRMNGQTVRITKSPEPNWVVLARFNWDQFLITYPDIHPSEYSSVNYNFDKVIKNDGTLTELYTQVNGLLQDYQYAR